MELMESPNYVINPIFSENSETIWDLKIDCNLCTNSLFNLRCIKCLIKIIRNLGSEKKKINCVVFENKWQLDASGTKIIRDLWEKRQNIENSLLFKLDPEREENFLPTIIKSLMKTLPSPDIPTNFFEKNKISLDNETISFLKYSLNLNSTSQTYLEDLFGPFLKKKASRFEDNRVFGKQKAMYNVCAANIFQVEIYETNGSELFYLMTPLYEEREFLHYKHIIQTTYSNIDDVFDPNLTLEDQIETLKKKGLFYLQKTFPGLKKEESEVIALFSALSFLNITKIYGLLADENIEECFLDSPQDAFYLDHKIYGRCRTNLRLNDTEVESFKSISKIMSKKRLETSFPSLKYSLNLFNSQFRIAIDIGPINLNDFSVTIRRPRNRGWNLSELIQNATISSELAAFLLWCSQNKINITVTGETDTGKTTLINAIDKLLPLNLRRIYIEDVKESLPRNFEAHQVFFQASDSDDVKSKSRLIISLLHRSPDFVYLGEILTQEEAQAMFQALSVGLRGFQTIHSYSIESLIDRWIVHFKINQSALQNLGLIVLMKKIGENRVVAEIAEILVRGDKFELIKIVNFDPEENDWIYAKSLFNCTKVQQNLKFQNLDESAFYLLLKKLEETIKRK